MGDNKDTQRVITVPQFEFGFTKRAGRLSYMVVSSTGCIDKTLLGRSFVGVVSFNQLNVLQRLRQLEIT